MSTTPLRTPSSTHRSPPQVTRRRRTPTPQQAVWRDSNDSPPRFDTNPNAQRRLVFPHRLAAHIYEPSDPSLRSMPSVYNPRTPVNRSKLSHYTNKNRRHGGVRRSRRTRRHQK